MSNIITAPVLYTYKLELKIIEAGKSGSKYRKVGIFQW